MKQFRLNRATFKLGGGSPSNIQLVAKNDDSDETGTHYTLVMGANGTSKSRILAGCVDLLCAAERGKGGRSIGSTYVDADVTVNGVKLHLNPYKQDIHDSTVLPARVLAIANLVRDRFTFGRREEGQNQYYYYLGVRQSSNLATTGSMDRIVAEAILNVIAGNKKYRAFKRWAEVLFPHLSFAIGIEQRDQDSFRTFLDDPEGYIKRYGYPSSYSRAGTRQVQIPSEQIHDMHVSMANLYGFLENRAPEPSDPDLFESRRRLKRIFFDLDEFTADGRKEMGGFVEDFNTARRLRLLYGPTIMLRDNSQSPSRWLEFSSLSSGEQNILSTGARIIAYAEPGSFIAIDEPEVSLNVVWQQRYIELISDALKDAPGCHVMIASHSPHLVSDLRRDNSTIVLAELQDTELKFTTHSGTFQGWGSEAVLYDVLHIPSASSFLLTRDLVGFP